MASLFIYFANPSRISVSVCYCSGVSWSSGRTSTSQRKDHAMAYSCS